MRTNAREHIAYYVSLVIILFLGLLLISQSQFGKSFQLIAAALTTFCYIIWGIVHHYVHHDISVKIMVEYVFVGSLGLAIMLFLIRA